MKNLQLYLMALLLPIYASGKPFPNGLHERRLDVVDCSVSNLVPSLSDCHSFYQCHNGLAFRQSCGFLLFNPISLHCDWPQTVTRIRSECRKTFAIFPNSNEVPVKWTKRPSQTQASLAGPPKDARPRKIHSGASFNPSNEKPLGTSSKTTTTGTTTTTTTTTTSTKTTNTTSTTQTKTTKTTTKTTTATTTMTTSTTKNLTAIKPNQVNTTIEVVEGRDLPIQENSPPTPLRNRSELPWSVSVVKPKESDILFPDKFFDSGTFNSIKDTMRSSTSQKEASAKGKYKNKSSRSNNGNNNPIPITKSPFDVEYMDYEYDMDAAVEEMAKATTTAALKMEDELFQLIYEAQNQDETIETPGKVTEDDDFPFVVSTPTTTTASPYIYDPFYPPFEELPDPLVFSPTWTPPTSNDLPNGLNDNLITNPVVITPDHRFTIEEPSPLAQPATATANGDDIFSKLAGLGTSSGMTPLLHAFKNEMHKFMSHDQVHDAAHHVLDNFGSNHMVQEAHQHAQFTEDQIQSILAMAATNPAMNSMSQDVLSHLTAEQLNLVADRIQESAVKAVQAQINEVMASKPIADVKKEVEAILKSEPLASLGGYIQDITQTNPLDGVTDQVKAVVQSPEVQGLRNKASDILNNDEIKLMAIKVYQILLSKPVQNLSNDIQRSVEQNLKNLGTGVDMILESQSQHIDALRQQMTKTGRQVSDGLNGLSSMKDELLQHGGQIVSGVAGLGQAASDMVSKTGQMIKATIDCPCQTQGSAHSPPSPPEPRALLDDANTKDRNGSPTALTRDVSTYFPVLDEEGDEVDDEVGDKVKEESSSSVFYFPFVPKQSSTTKVPPKQMANCLNHFLDCLDNIKAKEEQQGQANPSDNKSCQDHFQECSMSSDNSSSSSSSNSNIKNSP